MDAQSVVYSSRSNHPRNGNGNGHASLKVVRGASVAHRKLPVDPKIARQIIAHPAVVLSDESDRYETYRWRSRSESPARKALQARGVL